MRRLVKWRMISTLLDIDIAWGGYYASIPEDSGETSVFRLLDFNRDAYHAALFTDKFTTIPTLSELVELSPFIGHAPVDARAFVSNDDLRLIGGKPLTHDDLEGYMYYLNEYGLSKEETDGLVEQIISFSHEPPLSIRLEIVGEELIISERE